LGGAMAGRTDKSTLPNYRWIKLEIEYLNEPDFMSLSEGSTGTYLKLYLLAGKADAGGLLCNHNRVFTAKDLAWFLRCSTESLAFHLEELTNAGFLATDGEGFKVVRFFEEQGPGDNERREKWRLRQDKARARARGEPEQEGDLDTDRAAEGEGEVDIDIESHGDITVTPETTPPPPAAAAFSLEEEIFQNYWKAYMSRPLNKKKLGQFMDLIHQQKGVTDWPARLRDCLDIWKLVVESHSQEGWALCNPDAVMELYVIPNLEERMQREGKKWKDPKKEEERINLLRMYGLLRE